MRMTCYHALQTMQKPNLYAMQSATKIPLRKLITKIPPVPVDQELLKEGKLKPLTPRINRKLINVMLDPSRQRSDTRRVPIQRYVSLPTIKERLRFIEESVVKGYNFKEYDDVPNLTYMVSLYKMDENVVTLVPFTYKEMKNI